MIVTVTPAPALDWTLNVDSFELGTVNRAEDRGIEVSGKGVNISWALMRQNISTLAIFPSGGKSNELVREVLAENGMEHEIIHTSADMRTNVTLIVPNTPETKINTVGAPLQQSEIDALFAAVATHSDAASTIVICGSLPAECPITLHRDLAIEAHKSSARVIVDASGEALVVALEAKPDLIKPNASELAELTGETLHTLGDVEMAAQKARKLGAVAVLASLGSDGMLLVDQHGSLHAKVGKVEVKNAVGAGDASLAGFIAGGHDREASIASAVLWGSSAVSHETTLFEVIHELEKQITVTADFDRNTPLHETN